MIFKTNCKHCDHEFEIDGVNRSEFCPQCGKETFVLAQAQQPSIVPLSHPSGQAGESVFFHDGNILVTNARFTVGTKTFAMRGVTSVELVETDEYAGPNPADAFAKGFVTILGGLGFGLIVCGLLCWLIAGYSFWLFVVSGVVGCCLVVVVALLTTKRKQGFKIVLRTSGGEVTAFTNSDRNLVSQIVQALNNSIIALG
jgi:hypothetical protein